MVYTAAKPGGVRSGQLWTSQPAGTRCGDYVDLLSKGNVRHRFDVPRQGYKAYCAHDEPKDKVVVHDKFYTQVKDVHVPHMVPVPIPPPPRKVITQLGRGEDGSTVISNTTQEVMREL